MNVEPFRDPRDVICTLYRILLLYPELSQYSFQKIYVNTTVLAKLHNLNCASSSRASVFFHTVKCSNTCFNYIGIQNVCSQKGECVCSVSAAYRFKYFLCMKQVICRYIHISSLKTFLCQYVIWMDPFGPQSQKRMKTNGLIQARKQIPVNPCNIVRGVFQMFQPRLYV